MSVSLVVIRLEYAENHPSLKDIEFQAGTKYHLANKEKRDSGLSEWPLLVTDRLLAIHRGRREHSRISIVTLDEELITKEMAAFQETTSERGKNCEVEFDFQQNIDSEGNKDCLPRTGSIPRISSKESTPGPSSSKEGTPGASDDGGSRRGGKSFKDFLHFISGNPMVDVTHGFIHLFKENSKTSLEDGHSRSEMLCLLAVPTSTTIHDLLQFTAPCYPSIQHLRIIRDSNPNQYMVLIKFRTQADADLFYNTFNGQTFNSIEPEICRLVYVAKVETTSETEEGGLPIPGHTELPTCPVCLERMDESVEGILTILCNHSFHGECLAKWGDTSCPVCRYCQIPEEVPDQRCLSCGASESLWICLICGHVGCGRYVGGHAYRHFVETNHLFSLQVGNNRVWDYVRDNYVHRLLQSEGDGKVVSYERGSPIADTKEEMLREGGEKLTVLQLEYTHLLSSQLESQREFYENKIIDAQRDALREADESRELAQKKVEEAADIKSKLDVLTKEKQSVDKKLQQVNVKLNKVAKDLETEIHLNLSLREGKKEWEVKVTSLESSLKEKDQRIKDLESQVADIMTHLDALNTINSNPELQGGQVLLGETNRRSLGGRRRTKK